MRKILLLLVVVLFSHLLVGQSIEIRSVSSESYPKIELDVFDRNPKAWGKNEIRLLEDNKSIDSISISSIVPEKRPLKRVFILVENSHFPSFDAQRNYIKTFLSGSIDSFSEKDELYYSEFDWTLPDGKVLKRDGIAKGGKLEIERAIDNLKKPSTSPKTHESTELNTALMEALDYLDAIPEDPQYDKAIILFSSEFSNIYNSIHTPESIIISARQKDIPIYSVRYPRVAPKYTLAKITESTNGMHFGIDLAKDQGEQISAFQKIIEQINSRAAGNQYNISYTTNVSVGSKPVSLKIAKPDEAVQPEALLLAPGYIKYVLMDPIRLGLAVGCIFLILIFLVWIVFHLRKLRIREKQDNDRKLQSIQEESKRELGKQEKYLDKLENDRKSQKEREIIAQREQEIEKPVQASVSRFRQLPRAPFLSGQEGVNYPLGVVNLVGRGQQEGCSLVLGDSTISRKHAHILFERISLDQAPEENYSFFLVDLGSSNGSFVNERQVSSPVMLKNGDLIRFGKVNLTFRL